jgi:NAD(P)-dependent dehydrogenase (short-subunit alcohol dehydrogenase family)
MKGKSVVITGGTSGIGEVAAETLAQMGARIILVREPGSVRPRPSRQLAGHDHLRKLGVTLIPATAPVFFTEDTPVANQKGRLIPTGEESSPQTEATVQQRQPRLLVKKSDSRFRRLSRLQRQWTNDHRSVRN